MVDSKVVIEWLKKADEDNILIGLRSQTDRRSLNAFEGSK
jgi:hypothetical protein